MNPHRQLAAALNAHLEQRHEADLEDDHQPALAYHPPLILIEIDENHHTRPLSLVDRYPHGVAEYTNAMTRLAAATLRKDT